MEAREKRPKVSDAPDACERCNRKGAITHLVRFDNPKDYLFVCSECREALSSIKGYSSSTKITP